MGAQRSRVFAGVFQFSDLHHVAGWGDLALALVAMPNVLSAPGCSYLIEVASSFLREEFRSCGAVAACAVSDAASRVVQQIAALAV